MPTVIVRCRDCRTGIPSRIAVPGGKLSMLVVNGLRPQCEQCGVEDLYFTPDLYLPPLGAPPEPSPGADRGTLPGVDVTAAGVAGLRRGWHGAR